MQITISKTDLKALFSLIDRAVDIIQSDSTSLQEYNAARRLRLVKKKIIRRNETTINETFGT